MAIANYSSGIARMMEEEQTISYDEVFKHHYKPSELDKSLFTLEGPSDITMNDSDRFAMISPAMYDAMWAQNNKGDIEFGAPKPKHEYLKYGDELII